MNRMLWGIAFLVLATAGGWAQSTWRGQAEVWTGPTAPVDGFVVASNEFPRNTLLTVENYRTKRTIQVRVVDALPAGSSALVLLNAKAADALEIKAGDAPLVGVRIDPTGNDLAENPDPDVNPLAAKPAAAVAAAPPAPPVTAPVETPKAPTPAPSADTTLLPLPALAPPEPVPEPARTPLAVAEEPDAAAPVTPGKKVFLTTRDSEPVAGESPVVTEGTPAAPEAAVSPDAPAPASDTAAPASTAPDTAVTPVTPPAEAASGPTPAAPAPEAPAPEPPATPLAPAPVVEAPVAPAPVPTAPIAVKPAPASAWVSVPGKLQGPVLGQLAVLPGLERGRSYVQVGAWATEGDFLKAIDSVRSYVPLALYRAEGEKNPWRLVVASAPRSQLGVLLMSFRTQGFRGAAVVKG